MSARDLRSLNTYYMAPRPVYLVSVQHRDRINLFPMDLVGGISSGEFVLALRGTSPSIELIEESRRVAMSAAPASLLQVVYDLGAQHHASGIDVSALPFPIRPSPSFKLPVLADGGFAREVRVREVHRIGSHVLFVGEVESEAGHTPEQLAHVSAMYARWLTAAGRGLRAIG
jgi:flavin reductase (DIM6/NTAB) family NADH-FMN oxidoreductase RutF